MSETSVQVPRSVLVTLVSVLAASLMGLAFFMGRETGRPPSAPMAPPPVAVVTVTPVIEPTVTITAPAAHRPPHVAAPVLTSQPAIDPEVRATVTMTPTSRLPESPIAAALTPPPVEPQQTPAHLAPRPAATDAGRAVNVYFKEVDAIQPGSLSDDPEKFANEIVQGALNGDTSGLDKLISETDASRMKLKNLHPPASCVSYHEESMAMMDESVHVLQVMKNALKSNDAGALTSLASQAQAMQVRAKALKDKEAELKSQAARGAEPMAPGPAVKPRPSPRPKT